MNTYEHITQGAYQYLDNKNILNHQLKIMENWTPQQDPRYLDMGTQTITIHCYPNEETYAICGTQIPDMHYVVEGFDAALAVSKFIHDEFELFIKQ